MSRTPPRSATSSAVKPLRQDAQRNRRHVLEAARTVFGSDGLESDVQSVAKLAGVGTGTLYRHFPSKDDLIRALVDDLADEVQASADACLAEPNGTGLWTFLHTAAEIQARHQGLLCRLWAESPRDHQVEAIRAGISALVDAAHEAGTLPASVGQPDVVLLLQGLRGVIEANYRDRPDAYKRYLELAVVALTTQA
jgi:AcrR family transcriptional regulator